MNVLIVEDEQLAVLKLTKLLAEVAPHLEVAAATASVTGTIAYLENNPAPDLIFMDIELADDELESMLDPKLFFRSNRQYLINITAVQQIHSYFNNKLKITLRPAAEDEVLVSRERAADFKKWMGK